MCTVQKSNSFDPEVSAEPLHFTTTESMNDVTFSCQNSVRRTSDDSLVRVERVADSSALNALRRASRLGDASRLTTPEF